MRETKENKRICGTCARAAQHPYKPASKVICLKGYGVKRKTAIACKVFAALEEAVI